MKAKTLKGTSADEMQTALKNALLDGYKPTLAFVFISVKQNRDAICEMLNKECIQIFGATTAGEFIDGEIEAGSIVMMLLDINPAYFKIDFFEISPTTILEDANKLGITGKESFTNPAFIIANSGVSLDGLPKP